MPLPSTLLRSIVIGPTPLFETRKRPPPKAFAALFASVTPHSDTLWSLPSR